MPQYPSSYIINYLGQYFERYILSASVNILQDIARIPYFNKGNDPILRTNHIANLLITCILQLDQPNISNRYVNMYLDMHSDQGSWYESFSEEIARLIDNPKLIDNVYCIHMQGSYPYAEIWRKQYVQGILYYYKYVYSLDRYEVYNNMDDPESDNILTQKITRQMIRLDGDYLKRVALELSEPA